MRMISTLFLSLGVISVAHSGGSCNWLLSGNNSTSVRGMSSNGRMLFETFATDLSAEQSGKAVFWMDASSDRPVLVLRPETGDDPYEQDSAVIDASGQWIAFRRESGALVVQNLASGAKVIVASDAGGDIALSRDASRVAYVDRSTPNRFLRVVERSTGAELFSDFAADFSIGGFSDDGAFLVFDVSQRALAPEDVNMNEDAYLLRVGTGAIELLSSGQANFAGYAASISGDGSMLAWNEEDLLMFDEGTLLTRERQQMTAQPLVAATPEPPHFSPDGRYLAVIDRGPVDQGGDARLIRVDLTTSSVVVADQGNFSFSFLDRPWMTADGRQIFYTRDEDLESRGDCNGLTDVYLSAVEASNPRLISRARVRQRSLQNPGGSAGDRFGQAVSIKDGKLFVTAPNADNGAAGTGKVYVFRGEGADWILDEEIALPDGFFADGLGMALGLDGDTMVLGAPDTDPLLARKANLAGLQAALLQRIGQQWRFKQPIAPAAPESGNAFGAAIAIDNGGILVGAPNQSTAGPQAGAAFFFTIGANGMIQQNNEILPAVPGGKQVSAALFGQALALKKGVAAVGAPGSQVGNAVAGSVSLLQLIGNNLASMGTVNAAAPMPDASFGASIALSGNTLLVGAPGQNNSAGSAFVVNLQGNAVSPPIVPPGLVAGQAFGSSVALGLQRAIIGWPGFGIGAKGGNGSGAVFSLALDNGASDAFTSVGSGGDGVFSDPGAGPDEGLGSSVAIDGDTTLIGAPESIGEEGQVQVLFDPDDMTRLGFEGARLEAATITESGMVSACPAGSYHESQVFFDDLESGEGGWTHTGTSNDTWVLAATGGRDGTAGWTAIDLGAAGSQTLMSPVLTTFTSVPFVGADRALVLSFYQQRNLAGDPGNWMCDDGGKVEYRREGVRLPVSVIADPLDGDIPDITNNPLAGESVWCGNRDWRRSVVELARGTDGITSPAVVSVGADWKLGTNDGAADGSWAIDDVLVEFCVDQ